MVPAHPVTPLVYIGRRADDATTLISRPRALVVSRWIYYDLDEPEEAEAVHTDTASASTASSDLPEIHDIFIDKFKYPDQLIVRKTRQCFYISFPHIEVLP